MALFFMNGFAKDNILVEVLKRLSLVDPPDDSEDAMATLEQFFTHDVPAIQVVRERDWERMVTNVLAGGTALYVDGTREVLLIDAKLFPVRGLEEPTLERVVRGSRDGFVETLLTNVSLVRRRLRDKQLRYEIIQIGARSHTDVCVAYIADIVNMELLESVRDKLAAVRVDALPLADKQLEELTVSGGWFPWPLVRYSERPDVVSASLLEGHVAVFVDTSPSVMVLPATYFDLVQHAEENRQAPLIGSYLRWVRYVGILASLFLLPLWFLLASEPSLKPAALEFIGVQKSGKLPLIVQFILAEVGLDLLRLAAVHTPTPLATAMSLISAILIGDIAVKSGLFVNEVILYMAVAGVGMFATPSYELGLANRVVRIALLLAVAIAKVPGLMVVTTIMFVMLVMRRSFNHPYMWPLIPYNGAALWKILVRKPVNVETTRPELLRTQQQKRQG